MSHSHKNNEQSWDFAKELYYNSISKAEEIARKEYDDQQELEKKKQKTKHDKFVYLTDKYFEIIIISIFHKSNKGERVKYMNFDKNDFKANFPGLGYPNDFIKLWLDELTDYESSYLPIDEENQEKISLQGIECNVIYYNNHHITIKFQW